MRPALALPLTVLAGTLLAIQGRLNGDLSRHLAPGGAAVPAAAISFAVGTLAIALAVLVTGAWRPARGRLKRTPARWWFHLGGIGGAALVTVSAASVPVIGVALTSVFVVVGQTGGSLAVDSVGVGPGGRRRLTGARLAGSALAVVALVVGAGHSGGAASGPLLVAGIVGAGALVAGQQAVNGRLSGASGSPLYAALISFAVGTALLLAATAVLGRTGQLAHLHAGGSPWLYLGGLGGAVYIGLGAAFVHHLGVLRLSLASVTGQLAGGLVVDLAAPTAGTHVTVGTYAAVVLTVLALAVAGRPPRAGRPPAAAPLTEVPVARER